METELCVQMSTEHEQKEFKKLAMVLLLLLLFVCLQTNTSRSIFIWEYTQHLKIDR